MIPLIKEPDFNMFGYINSNINNNNYKNLKDSNRGSTATDIRSSGLNNVLNDITRNVRLKTVNRLSNMSRISGLEYEQYYENIDCDPVLQKQIIKIQSHVRRWIQGKKYKKILKYARYRLKVIDELVITENNYVAQLKQLIDLVYTPLILQSKPIEERQNHPIYLGYSENKLQYLQDVQVRKSDVESIFSNLESIIEINDKFAQSMSNRKQELTISSEFTDVCVEYAPHLKIYVMYLNNYEQSLKTLQIMKNNNPKFENYLMYVENYELKRDIQDYLIKPVQRLPKYILLLKDLLKNTNPRHRDYKNVVSAIEKFNELCSHNNEQMDKFIRENKLIELHRKFCKPHQRFNHISNDSIQNNNDSNSNQQQQSGINVSQNNSNNNSPQQNQKEQQSSRFSLNLFQNFGREKRRKSQNQQGGQTTNNNNNNTTNNNNNNNSNNNNNNNNPDANANGELQIIQIGVYREFLWEETLSLFQNDTQKIVTVYFLTDLILVSVKEPQEKGEYLLKYLQLNEASFYKNMSDLKYFSNLFRISGKNESLTFICESDESKCNLISRINKQILMPLRLKIQQKVIKKQEMLLQQQIKEQQNKSQILQSNNNELLQSNNTTLNNNIGDNQQQLSQIQQQNIQFGLNQNQLINSQIITSIDQTTNNTINSNNNNNNNPIITLNNQSSNILQNQQSLLTDNNEDIQFPIQVTVLGTEERVSSNKLKEKFTVYITEIQIGESIKQKIFVRYSEMIQLKEFIQKNIKQITDLEDLPRNIFTHHKTKVIEKRKILIENFLQKVLSHQGLQRHPLCLELLSFLDLPSNFFSLPLNIGESNFDFLNNIDTDSNNNNNASAFYTSMHASYYNDQDETENEEESLQYENVFDDDRYDEDGLGVSSNNKNLQQQYQMRQLSVGVGDLLGKKQNKKLINQNMNNSNILMDHTQSLTKSSDNNNINNSRNYDNLEIPINLNSSPYDPNNQKKKGSEDLNKSGGGNPLLLSQDLTNNQFLQNPHSSLDSEKEKEKEIEILTSDNKSYKININKNTKAIDLCETLSKQIGLITYLDFRIYVEDEKKNIRFLDDDEPIFKLIFKDELKKNELDTKKKEKEQQSSSSTSSQSQNQSSSSSSGGIQKIKDLKKAFLNKLGLKHSNQKYTLHFCKYIWLEHHLEETDYKTDPIRLSLIANQILESITQLKFALNNQDYYLYSALYLFIHHPQLIQAISNPDTNQKTAKNNLYQQIKQFLPTSILKQSKENVWIENLLVYIDTISEELSNAVKKSKQLLRDSYNNNLACSPSNQSNNNNNNNSNNDISKLNSTSDQSQSSQLDISQQDFLNSINTSNISINNNNNNLNNINHNNNQQINTTILTDKKKIACMVLINSIKTNRLYGATLFYCETYKKTIKDAKEQGLIIPQNIYCCVKCDSIHILNSSKSSTIKSFVYQDIKEIKVFPSSITFILQKEPNAYRFDTTQSFEISQLMKAYNNIRIDLEKSAITLDEESAHLKGIHNKDKS